MITKKIIKFKHISTDSITGDSISGSTGQYGVMIDISALSGINKNNIIGFYPTILKDIVWGDVLNLTFYNGNPHILSDHPSCSVHLEGLVYYIE